MSKSSERVFESIQQLLNTIELEASEQTNQELQDNFIVKDDLGYWWYFTGERIKMLGYCTESGGGYTCNSFAEGVKFLKEHGYITK